MKKLLLGFLASVICVPAIFAQANNPFNQLGIDVVAASKVVYQDYQNGKLNDINQKTLDFYFKKFFPQYGSINLGEFNQIVVGLKNSDNASIIKNSNYSEQGKAFLQKSLEHYSITQLVDEVQKSKISDTEKKDILCVLAINYNLIKPYFEQSGAAPGKGALAVNDLSEPLFSNRSSGVNAMIWGGIGFSMGSAFGGVGGIVGGLVGLVIGGWMDEKAIRPVIITSGGGGYYGGSGSSGGGWGPQP